MRSVCCHHCCVGLRSYSCSCSCTQASSHSGQAAVKREWPGWLEWLMAERVTWADSAAERLKRHALDAWEDRQLAAFWAQNLRPQRHERLKVEVGTVHDAHGSIPDHCAAALHLPKVCPPCPHSLQPLLAGRRCVSGRNFTACCTLPSHGEALSGAGFYLALATLHSNTQMASLRFQCPETGMLA